jgi:hypothetical protein
MPLVSKGYMSWTIAWAAAWSRAGEFETSKMRQSSTAAGSEAGEGRGRQGGGKVRVNGIQGRQGVWRHCVRTGKHHANHLGSGQQLQKCPCLRDPKPTAGEG